jgi:hypothetical protein
MKKLNMINPAKKVLGLLFLISCCCQGQAQTKNADPLLNNFMSPPAAAKPRVWWHWMNGNITQEGIRKDLQWMHRAGIGGFQNFDAGLTTPQVVKNRLTFMTPGWKEAFRFTTRLADSLGLEMAIAGSPGWSESGGPWVPAPEGMKKLVWSEVRIKGGKTFRGSLPKPPAVTGVFQNLHVQETMGLSGPHPPVPEYYEEVAVMAYKLPAADIALGDLKPKITASGGGFNLAQLTDGDVATTRLLPAATSGDQAWIQFSFEKPQVVKAVTVVGGGDKGPFGLFGEKADTRSLEVSEDGQQFRRVTYIPAGNLVQQTITIPETTARYFRVTFKNPPPLPNFAAMMGGGGEPPKAPAGTDIAEIVLHTSTRINRFEEKAAFAVAPALAAHPTPSTPDAVVEADIVDLTGKLQADGRLDWKVPAGNWKIVRFGYSLIGKQNHPASPEATGLEVDKLDARAIKAYFDNYLDQYKDATGGLMGSKGLQYLVTDSWESGAQNWTKNMPAEFARRRGYPLLPWMPVLTGQVVRSAQASDQFLWDYRKTIAELTAENHYDQLTILLAARGMKRYSESHENGRALIADGMDVKRTAAVPMSAMWTPGGIGGGENMHRADIRESASVAHIYGQNLVAAESFTALGMGGSAWAYSPEKLKPTADLELASGLNRFVIHTSVHQPVDDKIPGLGLGPFGQWFNRHETWAGQAGAWTDYLARSSFMLQQGEFVADVVYYYGEDSNITALFGTTLPDVPQGYNYDFINPDALLNLLSVQDGLLVTPSGMRYRMLVLDAGNTRLMSLKIASKIRDLVRAGAVVVGPKPAGTPSLTDNKEEFQAIVTELWGPDNAVKTTGSGKVYPNQSIQQVLTDLKIAPDFEYTKPQNNSELLFVHRQLPDQEIYWVNNRQDAFQQIEATFRVAGKTVEIWHPETGKTEPASYAVAEGRTKVDLALTPNDAVFVVFRGNASTSASLLPTPKETQLAAIENNWKVSFQPDRGAPAQITLNKLASWTESADPGVKYFSGTGTYTQTIAAPGKWFTSGSRLWLDLGDVEEMAEVVVNGKSLGVVWKKPFRVDATHALKPGKNMVEIKVTNLWVNRLIGDQQPGTTKKITYTTMPFYKRDAPLLPSGLLGPVKVVSVRQE